MPWLALEWSAVDWFGYAPIVLGLLITALTPQLARAVRRFEEWQLFLPGLVRAAGGLASGVARRWRTSAWHAARQVRAARREREAEERARVTEERVRAERGKVPVQMTAQRTPPARTPDKATEWPRTVRSRGSDRE